MPVRCNSGNKKSQRKDTWIHILRNTSGHPVNPPTLLVWSGWDFRGFGQRTGDLHLAAKDRHGSSDGRAENTLQRIRRPQSGEGGYVDINLEKGWEKTVCGINGDTRGRETERGRIRRKMSREELSKSNPFSPHTSTGCSEIKKRDVCESAVQRKGVCLGMSDKLSLGVTG